MLVINFIRMPPEVFAKLRSSRSTEHEMVSLAYPRAMAAGYVHEH
jgi:hypothetical protein